MKNLKYFERFMISEKKSIHTIKSYMSDISQMQRMVGKEDSEITYMDLIGWKVELNNNFMSASVDRKIRSIRKYFNFLYNAGLIEKDPTENLRSVKVKNKETRALTTDEVKAMISVSSGRDRAILLTLISTAMRVSEVINLTLNDFYEKEIHIVGKGEKERVVYLNNQTAKAIEDYLKVRKDGCDRLFVSNHRTPMDEKCISSMLKKLAKETGMFDDVSWITPHTMRRTRATIWSENGVPLASIMYSMGHSNIKTTMRYIKNNNNKCVREAMMMEV